LHFDRINLNQGAESTLAFLLALEEMTTLQTSAAASAEMADAAGTVRSEGLPGSSPSFAEIHSQARTREHGSSRQ
jgi:hypothetical protein